jgi:hypothetical protein
MNRTDKYLIVFFVFLLLLSFIKEGLGLDFSILMIGGFITGYFSIRKLIVPIFYEIIKHYEKESDDYPILNLHPPLKNRLIPGMFVIISSVLFFTLCYFLRWKSVFLMGIFLSWVVCGGMIISKNYHEMFIDDKRE